MQVFDPRQIQVPSGHFIGGRLVPEAGRMAVHRPSDGLPHAELPLGDATTVDAADSGMRPASSNRMVPRAISAPHWLTISSEVTAAG